MKALTKKLGHEISPRKRLPCLQPGKQPGKYFYSGFSIPLFPPVISTIYCTALRNSGMVPHAQSFSFYDLYR